MAGDTAAVETFLADLSPKDKPWDRHKFETVLVRQMYEKEQEFQRYAARLSECSGYLDFAQRLDQKSGEVTYKLRRAHFCRVRHCPICQWRRCLLWRAKLYQVMPQIQAENPTARYLYLVFTVRNCAIEELRETLKAMNKAWNRFVQRKEFKEFSLGWVRTTEVTRGKDGSAHPHFNVLLMVKPKYFDGKNYMSRDRWAQLWRSCAKLDYDPQVWVSIPKDKKAKATGENVPGNAVMEALKYSVKPDDMLQDVKWFHELNRQVKNLRFIAAGGVFKNFLKDEAEITEEDMVYVSEDGQEAEPNGETEDIVTFLWDAQKKRYAKHHSAQVRVAPDFEEEKWRDKLQALLAKNSKEPKSETEQPPKPTTPSKASKGFGVSFCSGAAVD